MTLNLPIVQTGWMDTIICGVRVWALSCISISNMKRYQYKWLNGGEAQVVQ